MPVQGEVNSLQITDIAGRQVFGSIHRSATPASVTVTEPLRGARLDPMTKVAAHLNHAVPGALFQAAYSPDGGRSFVPVALDLTDPNFMFDATAVPPSKGNGVIRIFTGDGLNTTSAEVTDLTTPPGDGACFEK